MDISASTSLPLSLSKSPAGLGISGSGSFQSHLSTGKSHQRLRAGIHSSPLVGKEGSSYNPNFMPNHASMQSSPSSRVTTGVSNWLTDVGPETHPYRLLLSWPKSWFHWVFLVYCCLSVIFFTTTIFKHRYLLRSSGKANIPRLFHHCPDNHDHCRYAYPVATRRPIEPTTTINDIGYLSTTERLRPICFTRKCTFKWNYCLFMVSRA
jgi:hypothetical protein